jgi:PilZ domain
MPRLQHAYGCMAYHTTIERRRCERTPLNVLIRIKRRDGSVIEGVCVDGSDMGFGVSAEAPLEVGEIVRLAIGRGAAPPSFIARVVRRQETRIGLYCIASAD